MEKNRKYGFVTKNVFDEMNIDKNKTIGITGFTGCLTKKETSHKGAWARIIKAQLRDCGYKNVKILEKEDHLDKYDIIIIDMGMEYKGTLNLFGGASDELADRLRSFVNYKNSGKEIFTIEGQFPDINALIKERFNSATENFRKLMLYAGDWERLHMHTINIDLIYRSHNVIVGDSHVLSMWRSGYQIMRHDGKTLHGMLKDYLSVYVPMYTSNLILYFGNIDIRHHLCREEHPLKSARKLVEDYINRIYEFHKITGLEMQNISIVAPLPIEDESRKLPKTGYYKGTPFFGSRKHRSKLKDLITNDLLRHSKEYDFNVILWPEHYIEDNKLSFDVMEKPKSVHLSPTHYYYDLENDKTNWRFIHKEQEGLF